MQQRAWGAIGRGAMDGVVATMPMTAFMLAAKRAGWMSEMPPRRIARRTLDGIQEETARGAGLPAATVLLHLGVGAAGGAVHRVLTEHPRWKRVRPLVRGLVTGTALWAAAYVGVLPALGLMPPPAADERRRPVAMLVAHWIYGATLASLASLASRAERAERRTRERAGPPEHPH